MRKLAAGETVDVPFVGRMADAVEVFRENGVKVRALTEAEIDGAARSQAQRASMMQTLQREFGNVVDAAIAGDFSDRELTVLAERGASDRHVAAPASRRASAPKRMAAAGNVAISADWNEF